jgi:hypothetical protein
MRPENRKWCLQEKVNHELEREFDSPNVLNVTKTNRLRYAGHMIRRPEDLKCKEKSRKTEIQVGGCGEQRQPGPRGQRLDALCTRQAYMERSSNEWYISVMFSLSHKNENVCKKKLENVY